MGQAGTEPTSSRPGPAAPDAAGQADLELARRVLRIEAAAVQALADRIDQRFVSAVDLLVACRGRTIVTGMGKSGLVCRKIAATLSSTGTPAFFLHPAEAVHGDLGVIQAEDVVIALSYSGGTAEVLRVLETTRRLGARVIAITGRLDSALGQAADVALDCRVDEEACPLNLAPTASTTAALAFGDALAMAVLVRRGFKVEDFAHLHPGGRLGKRLMHAAQLMHAGDGAPVVLATTPLRAVIEEITRKGLGMACVVDERRRLVGVITDGDLRRHVTRTPGFLDKPASEIMTARPRTITGSMLAVEALKILEDHRITSLVVTRDGDEVDGVLHLHDLWRAQMF